MEIIGGEDKGIDNGRDGQKTSFSGMETERREDRTKKKHTALDVPPSFRSHTITFRNGQKQLLEVKSCDLHLLKK